MAVVNTKSTAVTNADASSQTLNKKLISNGRARESIGKVAVANGDSIGSTLRFCRLHSSWRVSSIRVYCDAVTSAAMDVGIYQTNENGGAAVDADRFASAQSIATAILTGTEILLESAVLAPGDMEKPLWEALGLTADPGRFYDLVGTLTAAATAAGNVVLRVSHVNGD